MEPLSQEANAGKVAKKSKGKVTYTSSRQEVNTSNKGYYVPASYSSVTGEAVAKYALKYLGLPYRTARQGTSLKTGTDCSGFTMLVFANFGISLARSAPSQVNNGVSVGLSNIQPGDIVLSGYDGSICHSSLYIGNGKLVHALNSNVGIVVTDLYIMPIIDVRRVI